MRTFISIAAVAFILSPVYAKANCASAAAAIPTCAQKCLATAASKVGCTNATDLACQCVNSIVLQIAAEGCILDSCDAPTALRAAANSAAVCACLASQAVAPFALPLPLPGLPGLASIQTIAASSAAAAKPAPTAPPQGNGNNGNLSAPFGGLLSLLPGTVPTTLLTVPSLPKTGPLGTIVPNAGRRNISGGAHGCGLIPSIGLNSSFPNIGLNSSFIPHPPKAVPGAAPCAGSCQSKIGLGYFVCAMGRVRRLEV